MVELFVDIDEQSMTVSEHGRVIKTYDVSTAKNGPGEKKDSEKTPRGRHIVRAKIGKEAPLNAVFVGRRLTGEIYQTNMREQFPNRDWILTRIFWLSGLEPGKNRLGDVDTMRRYIYIHGTPDDVKMGQPGSRGCIRMRNKDIVELFDIVPVKSEIIIR